MNPSDRDATTHTPVPQQRAGDSACTCCLPTDSDERHENAGARDEISELEARHALVEQRLDALTASLADPAAAGREPGER